MLSAVATLLGTRRRGPVVAGPEGADVQPEDREAVDHYREVLEGYQSFFGALPGVIETLAGCATYEEMEGVLTWNWPTRVRARWAMALNWRKPRRATPGAFRSRRMKLSATAKSLITPSCMRSSGM